MGEPRQEAGGQAGTRGEVDKQGREVGGQAGKRCRKASRTRGGQVSRTRGGDCWHDCSARVGSTRWWV